MDKTIVDLTSIILAGAGLFVVLTKYDVPELRASFFGSNPFQEKRDIIERVMGRIFTTFVVFGLFLQAVKTALDPGTIPERIHTEVFYAVFALACVFAVVALSAVLSSLGKAYAKRKWLPAMVSSHREIYEQVRDIIQNDGWRSDQLSQISSLQNQDQYRRVNFETVDSSIIQMEALLDIPVHSGDRAERFRTIGIYFTG